MKIGDFTLFGPAVQIYTATHPMNAELRRNREFAKPIEIGSEVWVGGGAVICPGVQIGSRSAIAKDGQTVSLLKHEFLRWRVNTHLPPEEDQHFVCVGVPVPLARLAGMDGEASHGQRSPR